MKLSFRWLRLTASDELFEMNHPNLESALFLSADLLPVLISYRSHESHVDYIICNIYGSHASNDVHSYDLFNRKIRKTAILSILSAVQLPTRKWGYFSNFIRDPVWIIQSLDRIRNDSFRRMLSAYGFVTISIFDVQLQIALSKFY